VLFSPWAWAAQAMTQAMTVWTAVGRAMLGAPVERRP
jgi:hypothetical protein